MADWAGLHVDILVSILEKVRFIEDFVAFGYVCKSWREAVINNQRYSRPQTAWLTLTDRRHRRRLRTQILWPQIYGSPKYEMIRLNYGWWVLKKSREAELSLVNRLSGSQVKLPNLKLLNFRLSAALSANPSESSFYELMIATQGLNGATLSYWRTGDKWWTPIRNQPLENASTFCNLMHYHDQFYALDFSGRVWACRVPNLRDIHEKTSQ